MWYSNMYRRHLCDMHIDDWDERFLSEFSPEVYVENLKKAKIQNAMLYFQSHAGLCYFPTKVGHMHKSFIGDESKMRRLVDLCHENGIKVTGYYSLNYNTAEHDAHPDWRMLNHTGRSRRQGGIVSNGQALDFASAKSMRYGLCCPNNEDYRNFVYAQIKEMTDYFECEGYFFDMPFWSHTCYCDKCKARWAKEYGGDIPVDPVPGSEAFYRLLEAKNRWMGEWTQSVTDCVKSASAELSVEHNYASGIAGLSIAGCSEAVNESSDFVGGDLYGGMLNHSLACKFYKNITKNQPFDYMFSRCKPALGMHTLTKSYDEMKEEVMLTAAHHGATMVIDAIDPIGTMDERLYHRIGEVFEYHEKYEPYFVGEMVEDIGIYFGIRSKFELRGEGYSVINACKSVAGRLISNHIPFGVTGVYHELDKYRAIVMPIPTLSDMPDNERVIEYVKNGGKLYFSGSDNPELLTKLLDCEILGRTEEINIYVAPEKGREELFLDFNAKYPLPFTGSTPITKLPEDCEVLARITLPYTKPSNTAFASIHSNPPGVPTDIPAVVSRKYGKGEVLWSAVPLEMVEFYEYERIFINLLERLADLSELSFATDAPASVELTEFDAGEFLTVNAVLVEHATVAPTIAPFELKIKTEKKPKSVKLLPEGEELDFEYENGYTVFKSKTFKIFDMYKIEK